MRSKCLENSRKVARNILCASVILCVGSFLYCLHSSLLGDGNQWPFGETSLSQSDPELVAFIRKKYIIKPPVTKPGKPPQPCHWGDPLTTTYSKFGIVERKLIPLLFHDKNGKPIRGGTFLESGSLGQRLSGTLYMERFLGWKGLIAEMIPLHIQNILKIHRNNSTLVPACVAPVSWPMKTTFTTERNNENIPFALATILNKQFINDDYNWAKGAAKNLYIGKASCFPLYSILLAASNFTKIDFANLSFGGLEYQVLQTIPFDKVDMKVILFSLNNIREQPPLIHKLMQKQGYIQVPPELIIVRSRDVAYVRRDWAIERNLSFV